MKKFLAVVLVTLASLTQALTAQARKIEVWDFGAVAMAGSNVINHIKIADLDALENVAADGKFQAGDVTFGDLTYNAVNNDRAYNSGKKNYGTQGYSSFDFGDGYVSGGIWYCNGTGGEGRRYLLLKNVKAGDVVTFYARLSNSSSEKINFVHVDKDLVQTGKQKEVASIEGKSTKYQYIATQDGNYKIYTDTNGGKPVYYRVVRTPGVEVSGKLNGGLAKGSTLKFINQSTNQEIVAKLSSASYSVSLSAGYKWTAIVSGMQGYGISPDTKVIDIKTSDVAIGKISKNLNVAEQKTFKITGSISGLALDNKQTKKLGLVFEPPKDSVYQTMTAQLEINEGKIFYSASLEPAIDYRAVLVGVNDYEVKTGQKVNNTQNMTQDISAVLKPQYEVTGKFFSTNEGFVASDIPQIIEFQNVDDKYMYKGVIQKEGTYTAKLRNGTYKVFAESIRFDATNHVVVQDKNKTQDIKMTIKDKALPPQPLKKDLYVGKKGYSTLQKAIEAAKAMNPQSQKDRITIHIEPGVYRQQLIIETPYITLINDTPEKEVKLTWYYGIGYKYYSADAKTGFFDEDLAFDKMQKGSPARWGVATYIKPTAKYFKAKNITFETSFNKYVTDEEIKDGVTPDGSLPFERTRGSDVQSKAATERATALCIESDKSEFFNCKFIGSQDTLYTGASTTLYFRNCYIEGNTDFIFGDGDAVFQNCCIQWAGYTDRAQSGYLTAARNALKKGYLFYDCLISQDKSVYFTAGNFGRPWGKDAKVAWVNTILGSNSAILPQGWTGMSGNTPEQAGFREYNTVWGKEKLDLSERTQGTVLDKIEGYTPVDFLGDWSPEYMAQDKNATKGKFSKSPSFTTDDDINTPYPGHTITLHYTLGKADAEDASLISWYRLQDTGEETLIKQATGYSDKTYTLTKEDTGAKIKATVHALTRGGKDLGEKSVVLQAKVRQGVAFPSKAATFRRVLDKVNIFLAGDSTVKDYSANGMYSAGIIRDEGAWGEFLGCFFDNRVVAVQNYSNGGRSSRNFINEGSLDKIKENIGAGDYLFIQFGHNDCSNAQGYLEDRYVPLGSPDAKGIYPIKEGKKVPTPASYASKYGDTFYSWDCGGTYKWYLKQYIEVAKLAGATPVLVTPVSRLYFTDAGKIRPHHDSTDTSTKTQTTQNNAYVEAVRQLAKEEGVLLIDGFALTSSLYEDTYIKAGEATARQLMFTGDSTHNNKLGGFVLAAIFAKQIQSTIPALKPCIITPKSVAGKNNNGSFMFQVDSTGGFSCDSAYWNDYMKTFVLNQDKK